MCSLVCVYILKSKIWAGMHAHNGNFDAYDMNDAGSARVPFESEICYNSVNGGKSF